MTTSFNDFRFKGFHYQSVSPNYWLFTSQVNDDQTKVLVRIAAIDVFSYVNKDLQNAYVLKVDRTHCLFLKNWQYFTGHYGNYALLDKSHYYVATARKEFKEQPLYGELRTFAGALQKANMQQATRPDLTILVRKDEKTNKLFKKRKKNK